MTLAATDDDERLLGAIRTATMLLRIARLHDLVRKAGFRPDQPRVPSGQPDGGQWTDGDVGPQTVLTSYDPDSPPQLPETPPPSTRQRNIWAVRVARYLLSISSGAQMMRMRLWIWDHARARIVAYIDEPKSLDQLQRDASHPKPGYDIHHIVEQTPARRDGFPDSQIESWRNRVRIPTYKHWEINSWYETSDERF
jgi:hypothetical protein